MAFERLSESIRTLYAELLEQTIHAEAEAAALGVPSAGSFVKKEVKGRTYFYLQVSEGEHRRQHYLGPDSPALREWMDRVREARETTAQDEAGRAQLCKMLKSGGAFIQPASTVQVLELLAEAAVFRLGGVLVGTHAFSTYANALPHGTAGRVDRLGNSTSVRISLGHERTKAGLDEVLICGHGDR